MRMETKIAFSNAKYYKNKNTLIGIAIFLSSFLLFLVPTIGMDMINAQFAAVNKIYPTWYGVFRDVDADTVNKLANHHNVTDCGVRSDLGYITNNDSQISMMYMDDEAVALYRLNLEDGRMPETKNEIVVSKGMLDFLGINSGIGDSIELSYQIFQTGGLSYQKEGKFVISGFVTDSDAALEKNMYSSFASRQFMENEVPEKEIEYQFLFQTVADGKTNTDEIRAQITQLAEQFELEEEQVGINDEYLMANYVDPSIKPAIISIMLIIVLAGIITIYSIYYVNMPNRIQEFGRLKSLGATKTQIKRIVLLEGIGITCIALPIGLLTGTILTKAILTNVINLYSKDNVMMSTIQELMHQGKITFFSGWFYLLAIVITLVTVYLSLLKPMSIASKISEIDAMRYEQNMPFRKKAKKKVRKSYRSVSVLRLSQIYLFGNKKNSMVTIISMSMSGIFIMVIATVLSCANPRESANSSVLGQYRMSIDIQTGNKEHPEKEWNQVILNNPLTENLKKQTEQVDGIKSVSCFNAVYTSSDYFPDEGQTLRGVPKEFEDELLEGIIEGNVTIEELQNSNKIIIDKNLLYWYPDIQIGDEITLTILDGTNKHNITVEVAAIGDYPIGFSNYNYMLTTYNKVEAICGENLNETFSIFADKDFDEETYQNLQALIQDNELVEMDTWKEHYDNWESGMAFTSACCYTFLGIIAVICVMNMVNTMINSVQIRKKELGMMQAIGMTDHQLVRMLQQEGLFYTIGTLLVSIGLGSMIGYPIYLWAKWNAIFNINQYHYPWKAALIIAIALLLIQTILSYVLVKSVKKDSIIERIRFSE